MMMTFTSLARLMMVCFLIGGSAIASESPCASINSCLVVKKVWAKEGWKSVYEKELKIKTLCPHDSQYIQLEPKLGLNVSVSQTRMLGHPARDASIQIELSSYKLTSVLARGEAPASVSFIGLSHRLEPRGNAVIEASCAKR